MQPTENAPVFKAEPGTLYIVATPIGNLRDITLRALDILKSVDIIAAEDTRVTNGLLSAYGIGSKLFACHEHNEQHAAQTLVARLQEGKSVAFVSDAGTPGISDPGALLAKAVRAAGLTIVPLPGASAAITALSAAGMELPHWLFYGFLPHKSSARQSALSALKTAPHALVFYESPHRIAEAATDLCSVLGGERQVFVARELTKRFESFHACRLDALGTWLAADENNQRGEFVLIVSGAPQDVDAGWNEAVRVLEILLEDLPASQAARLAARLTGARKNALYDWALKSPHAQNEDA